MAHFIGSRMNNQLNISDSDGFGHGNSSTFVHFPEDGVD